MNFVSSPDIRMVITCAKFWVDRFIGISSRLAPEKWPLPLEVFIAHRLTLQNANVLQRNLHALPIPKVCSIFHLTIFFSNLSVVKIFRLAAAVILIWPRGSSAAASDVNNDKTVKQSYISLLLMHILSSWHWSKHMILILLEWTVEVSMYKQ